MDQGQDDDQEAQPLEVVLTLEAAYLLALILAREALPPAWAERFPSLN